WYSKTFYHQLQILRELLAEKYAMKASQVIMINLESFDSDGNKPTSEHKASGSRKTSVDSSTGKKKVSYQEFQKNRKNNGW
ncbi:MAG: hypothetical protein Q8J97_09235, partial [Flavobacteriaceae bacterium]|nr:hypothetical protein [Flavobacteriaceae bacterium]